MKRVIVESPYAGDIIQNTEYLKRCLRDSINRGEAPLASHLIYPFVLREDLRDERQLGIKLGYEWWSAADRIVFYIDRGWSPGMFKALDRAYTLGFAWEERTLEPKPGQLLRYDNSRATNWWRRLQRWRHGDTLEYFEQSSPREISLNLLRSGK